MAFESLGATQSNELVIETAARQKRPQSDGRRPDDRQDFSDGPSLGDGNLWRLAAELPE